MPEVATRDAYGKKLAELGERHPNIVVLDADLSCSTKTGLFAAKFPGFENFSGSDEVSVTDLKLFSVNDALSLNLLPLARKILETSVNY